MDKLDRLGWAEAVSLASYGVRVGIRVSTSNILEDLLKRIPVAWKPAASPIVERMYSVIAGRKSPRASLRLYNLVYANAERISRAADFEQSLEAFESDLQLYIAENAPRHLFVRSGVVGWRGRAIIMPGENFSGKTTIVREMVRAGATYYSDEYAVIDREGRVHPFLKPLGLRDGDKREINNPGGRAGIKPLEPAMILICKYKLGARWRPRRLSPGEGALEIMANAVSTRGRPARALATIHKVVSRATIMKGTCGEARQVVEYVLDSMSD